MSETTIPILPSRSIDETLEFYGALGFGTTYRQKSPNTYAVVRRGGIELHFFVLAQLAPADNWGTCYVVTSDVDGLYAAFTGGLRTLLGRVPSRGAPRINPLKDMPSYGVRQFVVVDPAGNYVRIGQPLPAGPTGPAVPARSSPGRTRLDRALESASLLADSKGDPAAAARVLDGALAAGGDPEPVLRFRALVLRADLALRLDEPGRARDLLRGAGPVPAGPDGTADLADERRRLAELRSALDEEGSGRVP